MQYIADLHIHSKYSRACSKQLELINIAYWSRVKGVDIISCGDFTHPFWFKELEDKLEPIEEGLYRLKEKVLKEFGFGSVRSTWNELVKPWEFLQKIKYSITEMQEVRFFLSTEVSCIYSKAGKMRRLHICIFAPSLETVRLINTELSRLGKLGSDGRPILGLDAKRLAEIVFKIDERCMVVPAHAWTPWFAIFGSKSGFDSLEECFEELTPKIYAIETGLSSNPLMNWRLSNLDNIVLVSNSDAHSPQNIAREANVFELEELSYDEICNAIKQKDKKKFLYTIEFYPEEGMYHYDGHRECNVSFHPKETKALLQNIAGEQKYICPQCKRELTIGVLHRVDNLADRKEEEVQKIQEKFIPYKSLVGLDDIIAEALGSKSRKTKAVLAEYERLIIQGKSELDVLQNVSYTELQNMTQEKIVEGIRRNRDGNVIIKPGYDGTYGYVKLFDEDKKNQLQQESLF